MSWEESRACTPLKRDWLRAWFAREQRFFLTGGSALGLFYLDHRRSYDLDLFTEAEVSPTEVRNLVIQVAEEIGASHEALRTAPDFHRFKVTRNEEKEIIDVVIDRALQLDTRKESFAAIRVDTLREIVANKLTTLVSRAELKDLVDLYFLERSGVDLMTAIPDARAKDGGWDPAMVVMILDGIEMKELPEWLIKDMDPELFQSFLSKLRMNVAKLALPSE